MTAPGTTETRLTADLGEVRRTLDLVLQPGQVTELRALDVSTSSYRRPHTVSGYFDDVETLIDALGYVERTAKGIYFTPNPVNAALLARAVNRLRDVADREPLTGDRDIISRRWLL